MTILELGKLVLVLLTFVGGSLEECFNTQTVSP